MWQNENEKHAKNNTIVFALLQMQSALKLKYFDNDEKTFYQFLALLKHRKIETASDIKSIAE